MGYVSVQEETDTRLLLVREPSIKAWAIFIALISFGAGAAYYSVDYFLWKMAYLSGAVFVGLSCMEDWEECLLDKETGQVSFKKQSLIQKLFQATKGQKIVSANLEDVISVRVQEEELAYSSGMGFMVIIFFNTGYSLGVTEVATTDDKSDHELIAKKIQKFLNLDAEAVISPISESPVGDDGGSTTSSDESFEQIDKAELIDEDPDLSPNIKDEEKDNTEENAEPEEKKEK